MEKVEVRALVCPICANGEFDGADINENFITCPCCKKSFVAEIGKKLAKVEIDRTNELKNLHKRLEEAISINNIEDIINISDAILNINPDSYLAKYFFAYGKRNRSDASRLYDFYASAPKQSECSPSEIHKILEHLIKHHDLGDYSKARAYVKSAVEVFGKELEPYTRNYENEHESRLAQEHKFLDIERDVFICHKSDDKEKVSKIVKQIKKAQRSYWISEENLRKNDPENYWKSINRAINSCRVFLYVYSENARHSEDVHKELEYASKIKKPIIEINIDGTNHFQGSPEDYYLDGKTWVDAYTDFEKGLALLGNRLHQTLEKIPNKIELSVKEEAPKAVEKAPDFSETHEYDIPTIDESDVTEQDLEPSYENGRRMLEIAKYTGNEECNKAAYRLFVAGAKNSSDPKCHFEMAKCLFTGTGVKKDEDAATEIFESYVGVIENQANRSDTEAMLLMAEYELSYADFPSDKKANEWFDKACEAGSVRAKCLRALHYFSSSPDDILYNENGEHVQAFYDDNGEVVYDSSMQWADIEAAYEGGFHLAYYEYGNLYSLKETSDYLYDEDSYEETVENLRKAKEIYRQGVEIAKDMRCQRRLSEIRFFKKGFEIFEGKLICINENLKNRKNIVVPEAVSSVGAYAFNFEGIESIEFLGQRVELDDEAFGNDGENIKSITSITVGAENVTGTILGKVMLHNEEVKQEQEEQEKLEKQKREEEEKLENQKRAKNEKIRNTIILLGSPVLVAVLAVLAGMIFGFANFPHWSMIIVYSAIIISGISCATFWTIDDDIPPAIACLILTAPVGIAGLWFGGTVTHWGIHIAIVIALVACAISLMDVFDLEETWVISLVSDVAVCLMILGSIFNWFNLGSVVTVIAGLVMMAASIVSLFISIYEYDPDITFLASIAALLGLATVLFAGFVVSWLAITISVLAVIALILTIYYVGKVNLWW